MRLNLLNSLANSIIIQMLINQPATGMNCQKNQCFFRRSALLISQVFKKGTQAFHEAIPALGNNLYKPGAGSNKINREIKRITDISENLILNFLSSGKNKEMYSDLPFTI